MTTQTDDDGWLPRRNAPWPVDEFPRGMGYTASIMADELERRFVKTAQQLWTRDTPLVVGVGGGIDSMALYQLLVRIQDRWPTPLIPVHVDHGLRPDSTHDASRLVQIFAQHFGVVLTVCHVRVDPGADDSLESAARRVRYQALRDEASRYGSRAKIAVGHQKNDQAETVLMRMLSGTGIRGLAGIPETNGPIVRPLLAVSRGELERYLDTFGLPWIEDPSNLDQSFLRNRIRHRVMPILEEINPQVVDALSSLGDRARSIDRYLEAQVDEWFKSQHTSPEAEAITLDVSSGAPLAALWLGILSRYAAAHHLRLSRRHLTQALAGTTHWPQGYVAEHLLDGRIRVGPDSSAGSSAPAIHAAPLARSGEMAFGFGVIHVEAGIFEEPRPGWQAVSAERWPEVWVRGWQAGDRIHPLGFHGHTKKVHDVFVDAKVARAARRFWPLAVASADSSLVLAVLGVVVGEEARAAVGDAVHWVAWRPGPP